MGRTVVCSDIHGNPFLLENVLSQSNFKEGDDKLVVAGDTCDRGKRSWDAYEMIFELGGIHLLGNHEISHLCGINIKPYDHSMDPDLIGFLGIGIDEGLFQMAHAVEGVLITHAGLSKRIVQKGVNENNSQDDFLHVHYASGTLSAEVAANLLNERVKNNIVLNKEEGTLTVKPDQMWVDWFHPFWFRPYQEADQGPKEAVGYYDGFKQIIGHTSPHYFSEKALRMITASGVTLVDPNDYRYWHADYCRYAVIEDGEVALHVNKKEAANAG